VVGLLSDISMVRRAHSLRPSPGEARRGKVCAAVALCAALLGGCSAFSGGSADTSSSPSRFTSLFSSTPSADTGNPAFNPSDCPPLEIRTGAGTLTAGGKPPASPTEVRYQLTFGQLARQCFAGAATLTIKVGVQGRIILGPVGGPGPVDVPLRYAVVSEGADPKTVFTKFKRIQVEVPPDQTNMVFSDIEEGLSVPLVPSAELSSYVVYVGYDSIGDAPEKKPPPKKPAPKRR
jgi:hypothetical protein